MKLNENRPVYSQIKEWVEDKIILGQWGPDSQVPSVRETSSIFRVNTNTVVRSYERLIFEETIYSVRGVGYFVSPKAAKSIIKRRRDEFFEDIFPAFIRQMEVLRIDPAEIVERINTLIPDSHEEKH